MKWQTVFNSLKTRSSDIFMNTVFSLPAPDFNLLSKEYSLGGKLCSCSSP